MEFAWPIGLLLLIVPLVLLAFYVAALRRRRKQAVRWSSVALLRQALPPSSRWRRHLPAALVLAGIAALALAAARPQMIRQVEVGRTSIILALDVSSSMCATDVDPNRLTAAQNAAAEFVRAQPEGTRIGIVAFSGFAEVAVAPTRDRDALVDAIEGLTTGRGTAIGAALLKSLDAIAEVNPDVSPVFEGADGATGGGTPPAQEGERDYVPDIVVLLTDGRNTRGVEPPEAVTEAVERRVRVYTIGFGTTQPSAMSCTAEQLGGAALGGAFGGGDGEGGSAGGRFAGGGRGLGNALVADEATLREVAQQSGGAFHAAADADELRQVFDDLPRQVERQDERQEMSWLPAGVGALLLLGALATSLRLSPYP